MPAHSGNIETDSPALCGLVRRLFPKPLFPRLAAAYQLTFSAGGGAEEIIARAKGLSFNPRPARVTQLAIQEGGLREEDSLLACILACAPDIQGDLADFGTARQIARAVLELRTSGSFDGNKDALVIALAHELDFMRHLHLADLHSLPVSSYLSRAELLMALGETGGQQTARLVVMLRQSCSRFITIAEAG